MGEGVGEDDAEGDADAEDDADADADADGDWVRVRPGDVAPGEVVKSARDAREGGDPEDDRADLLVDEGGSAPSSLP